MEDQTPPTTDTKNLSARSATALRDLETRAQRAMAASRDHTTQLEAEITKRLEQLAATLKTQAAADATSTADADGIRSQIESLQSELEDSRSTWTAERETLEVARDELSQRLAAIEAERNEAVERNTELVAERDETAKRLADFEAKCNDVGEQLIRLQSELDERSSQLAKVEADRDGATEELAKLRAAGEDSVERAAALEAAQRESGKEWQAQLKGFEDKLAEQQSAWNEQRAAWSAERESHAAERNELTQKFELALEDVQRFRGRVTELEQELSRRPEASEADSAELVALRAERDALSERVEELESQPATPTDGSEEQHLADLQRRFELAVEDVRELKTKNAELESKLASAGTLPAPIADVGSMDWESQKRRLLASLEDEGEAEDEPDRQQERLTIENTIEMTDSVVAEKDREIATLKAQIEESVKASDQNGDESDAKINELLDADEVIAEHRKRIAELEREMEDKLRAAELEISVERAKLARQKAEQENLRAELESQRNAIGPAGGEGGDGAPRRRWLSKLGLSGDEP